MQSPNTSTVLRSFVEIGVPVNPMNVAFGTALRTSRAMPCTVLAVSFPFSSTSSLTFSLRPYWLRCASSAITTMFLRVESASP